MSTKRRQKSFRVDPVEACLLAAQHARSWRVGRDRNEHPTPEQVTDSALWGIRRNLTHNRDAFLPEEGEPVASPEVIYEAWHAAVLQAARDGCCTSIPLSYPEDEHGNSTDRPDVQDVMPCVRKSKKQRSSGLAGRDVSNTMRTVRRYCDACSRAQDPYRGAEKHAECIAQAEELRKMLENDF